jgi:competence protein ComEC
MTADAMLHFLSKHRWMFPIMISLGIVAGLIMSHPVSEEVRVTFIDVGQGDAILIEMPGSRTALVDCGPSWEENDAGRQTVLPLMRSHSIRRLDALILTHSDTDHTGGAVSIMRRTPIGKVYLGGLSDHPLQLEKAFTMLRLHRIPVIRPMRGQRLDFGNGVIFHVLNPGQGCDSSENDCCLVLRMEYGGASLLLTGDAGENAEKEMIASGCRLDSQILKVAHHGSRASTSAAFLDACHPSLAVISVGMNNRFGHPSSEALDRLKTHGVRILRTDECGAIMAQTDGKIWWVHAQNDIPKIEPIKENVNPLLLSPGKRAFRCQRIPPLQLRRPASFPFRTISSFVR